MRVTLISTHRADRGHYAPLRRVLDADPHFEVVDVGPDAVIVLGDRYEMLAQAALWAERRVPLIHLHGGEHSFGSVDERYRYAITVLADTHCVAHEQARIQVRNFLRQLPERHDHIEVTGAPGLDGLADTEPAADAPAIVVAYNPVLDAETTRIESIAIRAALLERKDVLWIRPNGDRFTDYVPWLWESVEFGHERFRQVLCGAKVIVGNSSAGIIEAPTFGTWAVNIGQRQAGRVRGPNVIDVIGDSVDIRRAITTALGSPRPPRENPYGDGHACERIRDVLLRMSA